MRHYGREFDYAKLMIGEKVVPAMPDFCLPVVARLEESGYLPHPIDQLTVNECLSLRHSSHNTRYNMNINA